MVQLYGAGRAIPVASAVVLCRTPCWSCHPCGFSSGTVGDTLLVLPSLWLQQWYCGGHPAGPAIPVASAVVLWGTPCWSCHPCGFSSGTVGDTLLVLPSLWLQQWYCGGHPAGPAIPVASAVVLWGTPCWSCHPCGFSSGTVGDTLLVLPSLWLQQWYCGGHPTGPAIPVASAVVLWGTPCWSCHPCGFSSGTVGDTLLVLPSLWLQQWYCGGHPAGPAIPVASAVVLWGTPCWSCHPCGFSSGTVGDTLLVLPSLWLQQWYCGGHPAGPAIPVASAVVLWGTPY